MNDIELVVRGGTVVTGHDEFKADIGVRDGRIIAIAESLPAGREEVNATGRLVLPGGIDSHCHIEQESSLGGLWTADDFTSATRSAAFGGNTTVIPFAVQPRGASVREVVTDYRTRGDAKTCIDYSLHTIVTDPTPEALADELPEAIAAGVRSIKMYMAYDRMRVNDVQMLDVMATARRHGALPIAHAENWDMIRWTIDRLVEGGNTAPRYHALSHPRLAEAEGIHRAIRLAELVDVPIMIFHVSTEAGLEEIRRGRSRGVKVYAETCPQYLLLSAQDLDRPGSEGAMFCCSPPVRDTAQQELLWEALADGTLDLISSDHCPYRFDETGKLKNSSTPTFRQIPNGLPGIETRMPLIWSEGVKRGRLTPQRFVELTATTPACIYGLPTKGRMQIGADADFAIWEPERQVTISASDLHDNAGYSPYEGMTVTGWPTTVICRGKLVVDNGTFNVKPGFGRFIPGMPAEAMAPTGTVQPEFDKTVNFGTTVRI